MRLVPSSAGTGLGGLGPSVGAAASLVAAGVLLSVLVASLGVRVWPSPSDRGDAPTLRLPAVPTPETRRPSVPVEEPGRRVEARTAHSRSRGVEAPRAHAAPRRVSAPPAV